MFFLLLWIGNVGQHAHTRLYVFIPWRIINIAWLVGTQIHVSLYFEEMVGFSSVD
jgi:hypothetical protein